MIQQDIPLTNCSQLLRFLKAVGANFDQISGRTVLLIPVKESIVVVEEHGDSWITENEPRSHEDGIIPIE